MLILVSTSAAKIEFTVKQRLAVKVDRGIWHLARVTGIRRKYIDILFDDGEEGEFDKVADLRSVKVIPQTTSKNKGALTLAQVQELITVPEPKRVKKKVPEKQVTRRVMEMDVEPRNPREVIQDTNKPEQKPVITQRMGKPITITMKPKTTAVSPPPPEPRPQTTGTLRTRLKEHDDKPIHPIDLNRGMVVQVAMNATLFTVLLLRYEEGKWQAVMLRENSKIVQISPNHCFTRKAPLIPYERLWAGKYMRRLDEMES